MRRRFLFLVTIVMILLGQPTSSGQTPTEPLTPEQRQELHAEAEQLNAKGLELFRSGKPDQALTLMRQYLEIQQRLHPQTDHKDVAVALNAMGTLLTSMAKYQQALPLFRDALNMLKRLHKDQDHPNVAMSLHNMGYLLQAMGKHEKALPFYQDALNMLKRFHKDQDHPDVATSLNNIGHLRVTMGEPEMALPFFTEALAMKKRLYQDKDHPDLASGLNNMGSVLQEMGDYERALHFFTKALDMRKRLHQGNDHPELFVSLNNMGGLLQAMGQYEKALAFFTEALAMNKRLHHDQDHPELATSLQNMGTLLWAMGEYEKALPLLSDGLNMRKRLSSGQDHPHLAISLSYMGALLQSLGEYERALDFYTNALNMRKRLSSGKDHPDVARSLNEVGNLIELMDKDEQALLFVTDALAMYRRLYPDQDHFNLASCLSSMGYLLKSMGEYEKALPFVTDALAMYRRLYPNQDHPHVAVSLNHMGALLQSLGKYEPALPFYTEAIQMQQRYSEREAALAPMVEALALVRSIPNVRSALLSVSERVPNQNRNVWETIWTTKSALARLLRARHRLARLEQTESRGVRDTVLELRKQRRKLTILLQQPPTPERDKALRELTDRIEQSDRALARELGQEGQLTKVALTDLKARLTQGQVFIDLYRYYDWAAQEPDRQYRYVAFVLTSEADPLRVELGPAQPIEEAVTAWRKALIEQIDSADGASVRKLLWEPIEKHLPITPTVIYISPDQDLGRIPFAALPAANPKQILLEQYPIALIPSGPFLLEHLSDSKKASHVDRTVLLAGGIDYGHGEGKGWPYLEGTAREIAQVRELVTDHSVVDAQGTGATTEWLLKHLPQARLAHIATHGAFRADEYTQEQIRLQKTRRDRLGELSPTLPASTKPGRGSMIAGGGVRHPLGYVGLVMAGANTAKGGTTSGLDILDLDLSRMELAVLSACETGLGKHTGAVGVQNLQLAFHIAGCRNVIASLWKVDDESTAALMAKFYHELWVKKKPAIEALRQAQLTIYHHPERIGTLARERGIKFDKVAQLPVREDKASGKARGKTHPKLWAAFVLSGVGQ